MSKTSLIVVASSDPQIREMARQAAQEEHFEAILCGDGLEVLESVPQQLAQGNRIQLLVLDSFLPKTDGFEVTRKLQDHEQAKTIPVLMLVLRASDKAASPFADRAQSGKIKLRADNYLQKPFESQELKSAIHSMTKYYRPHDSAHPITKLPGHTEIEREILLRLSRGESFQMVWLDINYFRPYNDHYGSQKGNAVIAYAAELLKQQIKKINLPAGQTPIALAHVDGDDFVFLAPADSADVLRQNAAEDFAKNNTNFYAADEIKNGFFYEKSRENEKQQIFPLMHLSSVSLPISLEKFSDYGQLAALAKDQLHQAKISAEKI